MLIWERVVLESLSQGEKRLGELCEDTLLKVSMLKIILGDLMQEKIVLESAGLYKINRELCLEDETIREEVKDVFSSLVGLYFKNKSQIRMKKIFLTPSELEVFQMQLYSLEGFLEKISKEKREKRLHEQRVIIWGHAPYAHLLDEI